MNNSLIFNTHKTCCQQVFYDVIFYFPLLIRHNKDFMYAALYDQLVVRLESKAVREQEK